MFFPNKKTNKTLLKKTVLEIHFFSLIATFKIQKRIFNLRVDFAESQVKLWNVCTLTYSGSLRVSTRRHILSSQTGLRFLWMVLLRNTSFPAILNFTYGSLVPVEKVLQTKRIHCLKKWTRVSDFKSVSEWTLCEGKWWQCQFSKSFLSMIKTKYHRQLLQ